MKTALQLIVFYGVVAGLLCRVNGNFLTNIAELKNGGSGNIENCTENGFKSIVLPSDNTVQLLWKWAEFFQKNFYTAYMTIIQRLYDQCTHFTNKDGNTQTKNVNLIPTNQKIHSKSATRELEGNILKRITRNANLTVVDYSTNVPDILLHITASNVSMIKNQTEPNLNLSTTSTKIIEKNTHTLLASFTTLLPHLHNTHTEQNNVNLTHEDSKINILLPFSSNQSTYFFNPLTTLMIAFGITIIALGIVLWINKILKDRVNRQIFHIGGACHNYNETAV